MRRTSPPQAGSGTGPGDAPAEKKGRPKAATAVPEAGAKGTGAAKRQAPREGAGAPARGRGKGRGTPPALAAVDPPNKQDVRQHGTDKAGKGRNAAAAAPNRKTRKPPMSRQRGRNELETSGRARFPGQLRPLAPAAGRDVRLGWVQVPRAKVSERQRANDSARTPPKGRNEPPEGPAGKRPSGARKGRGPSRAA